MPTTSEKTSSIFSRARQWLNGPGKNTVIIGWQCFAASYLLWLVISQSVTAGSFPPKRVEDPQTLLLFYGVITWCAFAMIAGIAILCKKAWGWWLELAIMLPAGIGVMIYFWIGRTLPPSTAMQWVELFAAVLFTFVTIQSLRDLVKKVKLEAGRAAKNP
ncbi:MAG: hypothetical protein ABIV13_03530 [Fimbriimonadales bacterium]